MFQLMRNWVICYARSAQRYASQPANCQFIQTLRVGGDQKVVYIFILSSFFCFFFQVPKRYPVFSIFFISVGDAVVIIQ